MKDSVLKETIQNLTLSVAQKTQINDDATDSVSDTYSASKIEELIATIPSGGTPTVATGAEVDTGTDDTKMVTPKAMEDSSYSKLALGETSVTAYRGDRGKTAYDHSQVTHAPSDADKTATVISESDAGEPSGSANFPFTDEGALAHITFDSLKTLLQQYFDTLYTPL